MKHNRYHPVRIPYFRGTNHDLGRAILKMRDDCILDIFQGMIRGLHEEISGDKKRGYCKLVALLCKAMRRVFDAYAFWCSRAKNNTYSCQKSYSRIPYVRLNNFELGRKIIHMRYDCVLDVFRGMSSQMHEAGSPRLYSRQTDYRDSGARIFDRIVLSFQDIYVLCRPHILAETR